MWLHQTGFLENARWCTYTLCEWEGKKRDTEKEKIKHMN